jgi:hypothetical protein
VARAGRSFWRNAEPAKAPPPHPQRPGRRRPQPQPHSRALFSHGGSSRLRLLRRARPLLREQANIPPSSRRVRAARRTPSYGPILRLASITTREPGISGTPAMARICARLTRAPPDIAPRRTANVRPGPRLGKDIVGPALRARGAFISLSHDVAGGRLRSTKFEWPTPNDMQRRHRP